MQQRGMCGQPLTDEVDARTQGAARCNEVVNLQAPRRGCQWVHQALPCQPLISLPELAGGGGIQLTQVTGV